MTYLIKCYGCGFVYDVICNCDTEDLVYCIHCGKEMIKLISEGG